MLGNEAVLNHSALMQLPYTSLDLLSVGLFSVKSPPFYQDSSALLYPTTFHSHPLSPSSSPILPSTPPSRFPQQRARFFRVEFFSVRWNYDCHKRWRDRKKTRAHRMERITAGKKTETWRKTMNWRTGNLPVEIMYPRGREKDKNHSGITDHWFFFYS